MVDQSPSKRTQDDGGRKRVLSSPSGSPEPKRQEKDDNKPNDAIKPKEKSKPHFNRGGGSRYVFQRDDPFIPRHITHGKPASFMVRPSLINPAGNANASSSIPAFPRNGQADGKTPADMALINAAHRILREFKATKDEMHGLYHEMAQERRKKHDLANSLEVTKTKLQSKTNELAGILTEVLRRTEPEDKSSAADVTAETDPERVMALCVHERDRRKGLQFKLDRAASKLEAQTKAITKLRADVERRERGECNTYCAKEIASLSEKLTEETRQRIIERTEKQARIAELEAEVDGLKKTILDQEATIQRRAPLDGRDHPRDVESMRRQLRDMKVSLDKAEIARKVAEGAAMKRGSVSIEVADSIQSFLGTYPSSLPRFPK